MGITTKTKDKSNLPPVEMRATDKKRLYMSKAQVLEAERVINERKRKVEEFKQKLEVSNGVLSEEADEKGQEVEEVVSGATEEVVGGGNSPLVKKRKVYGKKSASQPTV